MFLAWLENRVHAILKEQSGKPWANVSKANLPRSAFLWVEDPKRKSTWHLPYREGTGGIDPATEMYRQAGAVNLAALRAIAAAIGGARTGTPMAMPSQVRSKITNLLKKYKIGKFKENMPMKIHGTELTEQGVGLLRDAKLDKESRTIKGVAILRPTSSNKIFRESKGRRYSRAALEECVSFVNGSKAYMNHASKKQMEDSGGVRKVEDLIGYYDGGRLDESEVVRGDLHYLPARAEVVESLVEHMADKIGNSVHAFGDVGFDKSTQYEIVEHLDRLASVDLVTEPGSTVNLFETAQGEGEEDVEVDFSKITLEELNEQRGDIVQSIKDQVMSEVDDTKAMETLKEANAKLTKDVKDLKVKVDDYEVKEAAANRETEIQKFVKEAKLDDKHVTDTFRQSLREAKDDAAVKALIEDRKKLVTSAGSKDGVQGMGDEKKTDEELDESKQGSEDDYEKAVTG